MKRADAPPELSKAAFNCPHCGVFARQTWHGVHGHPFAKNQLPPAPKDCENLAGLEAAISQKPVEGNIDRTHFRRLASGMPFAKGAGSQVIDQNFTIFYNFYFSQCFNCDQISVWIGQSMVWPKASLVPEPNDDLTDEIKDDYDEARRIADLSPRGSAAILRLCIQKLCKFLGEKGKNIDDDIASLVKKGLDPRVQQALDVVRVIGNNAVHPGQIDLRDDRTTTRDLFGLVNLIADIMITQPKHVQEMYESLPEASRKAIERRDGT